MIPEMYFGFELALVVSSIVLLAAALNHDSSVTAADVK
jgi:hypothetical protein